MYAEVCLACPAATGRSAVLMSPGHALIHAAMCFACAAAPDSLARNIALLYSAVCCACVAAGA